MVRTYIFHSRQLVVKSKFSCYFLQQIALKTVLSNKLLFESKADATDVIFKCITITTSVIKRVCLSHTCSVVDLLVYWYWRPDSQFWFLFLKLSLYLGENNDWTISLPERFIVQQIIRLEFQVKTLHTWFQFLSPAKVILLWMS